MFSKPVWLGRAVPVTSLALAASLIRFASGSSPGDGSGSVGRPIRRCQRGARFSIATSRRSADARPCCRTIRPCHGHVQRALVGHGGHD